MEKRGERIAGSRLFRDFCAGCREPIRVAQVFSKVGPIGNYCEVCKPPHDPHGTAQPTPDDDPWQSNAIRALEND